MIYFSYMYTIENIHWKFNLPHYFSLNYSLSIKERAFIECVLKYSSNGKLQNKFVANLPEAVWRVKMLTVKIHDINTFILMVSNKGRDSLGKVQIQIYKYFWWIVKTVPHLLPCLLCHFKIVFLEPCSKNS